ncbi:MAG: PKD domain-containing protein, partial [bacterium]|nr:PKD domain-containing protein [bacterium]
MNTASSTIGTAPFAVFFDAVDGSSGVLQPESINGRKEYADLFYYWDFGDPGKGNWPESNKSKNHDIGYVASHVYEDPGTYTVTLTVKNMSGSTYTYTQEITVQDPDIVFSGENTICISSTGSFEGAPAGALQITTSDITEMENYIAD